MTSPSAETLLRTGIAAYKTGDKERATACFREALAIDPRNEYAWIWMAAVMDKDDARRFCLERALAINPHNEAARRYLEKMAAKGAVIVTGANAPHRENHPLERPRPPQPAAAAEPSSPAQIIDPTIRVSAPVSSSPAPVNTAATSSYLSSAPQNPLPTHAPASASATPTADLPVQPAHGSAKPEAEWYYVHKNRRVGPVQEHVIQQLMSAGVISRKSLVWTHGMEQWTPLEFTPLVRLLAPASGHIAATGQPSPGAASLHRPGAADQRPWYYSRGCLILTFLFLTPVWVLMILMDWKRQGWGVRILASVIGFFYVMWFGLATLNAVLSSTAATRTSAVEAPRSAPSPTATAAPSRVGLGVTRQQVEAFYQVMGFVFEKDQPYKGQDRTQAEENRENIRHSVTVIGPDDNILSVRTAILLPPHAGIDRAEAADIVAFLLSGIPIAAPDWWEDDGRKWIHRTTEEWLEEMAYREEFSSETDIDDTRRVSFSVLPGLQDTSIIVVDIGVKEELWPK